MIARCVIVLAGLLVAGSAWAETMGPEAARRFVTGKLFAFNCFDGSRGAGRIYGVWLPAGTLRVKGEAVCASIQGMPFEPCFNLSRTGDQSFRGSVSGFGIAYCDFTRRVTVAGLGPRRHSSEPLPLTPGGSN